MAKEPKSPEILTDDSKVTTRFEVTSQDLIAIAASDEETRLRREQADAERALQGAKAAHGALEERIVQELKLLLESRYRKHIDRIVRGAKGLGVALSSDVCVHLDGVSIKGVISISSDSSARGGIRANIELDAPAELVAGRAAALQRIEQSEDRVLGLRRALQDLPALERRARAAFARRVLGDSESGRELLRTIEPLKAIDYQAG